MKSHSHREAIMKISRFFSRKRFSAEEVKKTKRLAMAHNLKLGILRKTFCKSCLSQLKGKTRISKSKLGVYKTIICKKCGRKNMFKVNH
jgi:RNase P subunit RPR2